MLLSASLSASGNELDISYFSCRGYTSQSEMWGAAQRFIKNARNQQKTHIIHLGDHDPSGIDMSRDIEDRIRMFMTHHIGHATTNLEFTRASLSTATRLICIKASAEPR